jgi:hypothetical protein
MVSVKPETALNHILDEIKKLVDVDAPDPFSLRRVSMAVESAWKSKAISPAEFHMAKALIFMAKKERDSAISSMRNAVGLGKADPIVQHNSMIVFSSAGSVDDGVSLVTAWPKIFPDNREMLRTAVSRSCDFLQLELAMDIATQLDQISRNDPSHVSLVSHQLLNCLDAAKSLGLTDADLAARLKVAVSVLVDRGHPMWRNSRNLLRDGSLIYSFHIEASPEDCAELNFDIADALVDSFADPSAEFLSISCRPLVDIAQFSDG